MRAVIFAYDKGSRFTFSPREPGFPMGQLPAPHSVAGLHGNFVGWKVRRELVAESLLRNTYRAFDYPSELGPLGLRRSVQGDLLA